MTLTQAEGILTNRDSHESSDVKSDVIYATERGQAPGNLLEGRLGTSKYFEADTQAVIIRTGDRVHYQG